MNVKLRIKKPIGVVLFCGAGGSSLGMEEAGVSVDLGVNHNAQAIESHAANFPTCQNLREDVFQALPNRVWGSDRPLDVLWASPSCTHFSRARGGSPVSDQERSLANIVLLWAKECRPRITIVENVSEWVSWGPLNADNKPDKARAGEFFRAWVSSMESLGYDVEWRILRACDYGTPTIRKRLYLIARRDGNEIAWPRPTHGPGRDLPWKTAADCIDWSLPRGQSIFNRKKPLADATMRKIAEGLNKFVLGNQTPFILNLSHGGRLERIDEPMRTVTSTPKGGDRILVTPQLGEGGDSSSSQRVAAFLIAYYSGGGSSSSLASPLSAVVTKARHGLVCATLDGRVVQDITLRMLTPNELLAAQGFKPGYRLVGSKADQIRQIGNSVCPPVAEAITRANLD